MQNCTGKCNGFMFFWINIKMVTPSFFLLDKAMNLLWIIAGPKVDSLIAIHGTINIKLVGQKRIDYLIGCVLRIQNLEIGRLRF